ncbi:MAG: hypothetical protein JWQ51_1717, partial [Tardiphaga sp.]|nr:hypothetical protein [Tardiphaga sp.]
PMTQADGVLIMPPIDPSRLQILLEHEAARQASLVLVRRLRREARVEIDRLITFLDASDYYVQTELEDDFDDNGEDELEPSLGSFDRMTDQSRSWRAVQGEQIAEIDAEKDDCDAECSDTGIADRDGLYEQTGRSEFGTS